MKGRVPANLAPLTRCSSLPLGWLVVGQIRKRLGVGPHQPVDSFGIASCFSWEPCEPERLKNKLKTRVPGKNFGWCEAVAVRFRPRDGYLPVETGVFGFPVRRAASPAEASELRAGRVPRFRFQQPSLSGPIECSHRIESGALPTASPSSFLDHCQQPMQGLSWQRLPASTPATSSGFSS